MILKEALPLLEEITKHQPYPLLFATVSGAHLYGFPSANSDYDLRGVHVLPKEECLSLKKERETIEVSEEKELELDLVTHDLKKFFLLLLRPNGYVLEQLLSPIIIHQMKEHEELKSNAHLFITRHHAHHYLGFSKSQWRLFAKESPHRIKPLLYVFRTLLTGIHLMEEGIVEANLLKLNEKYGLSYLNELVEAKISGAEKETLPTNDIEIFQSEFNRLTKELEAKRDSTHLPEKPSGFDFLDSLLLRLRLPPSGAQ